MKIGKILKEQQPDIYKKLKLFKEKENEFNFYKNLMEHDSYYRTKGGALRQKIRR